MAHHRRRATQSSGSRRTLFDLQAEICQALGHGRRLEILDLLAGGERSNAYLLATLDISKANLSQHLAIMRRAGLVESRQQGREIFHRSAFPELKDACRIIRSLLAARLHRGTHLARSLVVHSAPEAASPAEPVRRRP